MSRAELIGDYFRKRVAKPFHHSLDGVHVWPSIRSPLMKVEVICVDGNILVAAVTPGSDDYSIRQSMNNRPKRDIEIDLTVFPSRQDALDAVVLSAFLHERVTFHDRRLSEIATKLGAKLKPAFGRGEETAEDEPDAGAPKP